MGRVRVEPFSRIPLPRHDTNQPDTLTRIDTPKKHGAVGTWNVTVWRWSQASKRSCGPGRFAHTRYQFAFLFLKIIIRDKKVVEFLLKKQKQNTDSVKRKWWRHYHGEKHVVWWRLTHILSGFALFLFDFWFLIVFFFFFDLIVFGFFWLQLFLT